MSAIDYAAVIMDLATQGKSKVEIAAALKLSKKKFDQLLADNPDLNEVYEQAETIVEAYLTELVRKGMLGEKELREPLVKLYMQNKAGWGERQSIEPTTAIKNLEDIKKLILEKQKRLGFEQKTIEIIEPVVVIKDDE